jgi:hypothetical protein
MSYQADLKDCQKLNGQVAGNGQCVMFVLKVTDAPASSLWSQGKLAKGLGPIDRPPGTAIATFGENGKYTNRFDGSAHGAIYISQNAVGIDVWDQWTGQPVHKRTLLFRNGIGLACNDGDKFYVVE